jgi:hypothetical protein
MTASIRCNAGFASRLLRPRVTRIFSAVDGPAIAALRAACAERGTDKETWK